MINKNIIKEQQINKLKVLENKDNKNIKSIIDNMFNADNEQMKSIIKNELFFENIYQDELEFHMNKIKNIENIADKFYVQFMMSGEEGFEMTCMRTALANRSTY